ncbi:hypothetical protein LIA77_09618 [Sarocladium implicatum]|nr:hypothetical protein LIA77_09618 [Sarocladium implicatum]
MQLEMEEWGGSVWQGPGLRDTIPFGIKQRKSSTVRKVCSFFPKPFRRQWSLRNETWPGPAGVGISFDNVPLQRGRSHPKSGCGWLARTTTGRAGQCMQLHGV